VLRRARLRAVLGLIGVRVLGLFAWALPGVRQKQAWTPAPPDPKAPSATPCRVVYEQRTGTGNRFSAMVTVHNDGPAPISPWRVEFAWPGDQTLLDAQGAQVSQQGRNVVLRPRPAVNAGRGPRSSRAHRQVRLPTPCLRGSRSPVRPVTGDHGLADGPGRRRRGRPAAAEPAGREPVGCQPVAREPQGRAATTAGTAKVANTAATGNGPAPELDTTDGVPG
jgi:hypothetical protein